MAILLLARIGLVFVQSRSFTETWILLALGGFALAFVIGVGFMARTRVALRRAVASAEPDAALTRGLVGRWVTGYRAVLAIALFVLWDMVFRPGL